MVSLVVYLYNLISDHMTRVMSFKKRSNSIKGDVGYTLPTSKCWSLGDGAGFEELKFLVDPSRFDLRYEIFIFII